jgi:SpoIIAA-like
LWWFSGAAPPPCRRAKEHKLESQHNVSAEELQLLTKTYEVAPVIERLKETGGVAFGFKIVGKLLDEHLKAFEPQLEFFIAQHKEHPIGILADLTEMDGAEWKARWDDLRFLQKHTSQIARMAIVGAHRWEEVVELFTAGAAVLQSETRYFESSEMQHAWQWARTAKHAEDVPVRVISPATGIWKDYRPEFVGL